MSQSLHSFSDESTSFGPPEQRRRPRRSCPSSLTIHPLEDGMMGEGERVQNEDFSTLGLGFTHDRALEKGTQFLVPLAKRNGPPLPLLYSVVHCRPTAGGMFQIGAELVSVLDMDQYAKHRMPDESIAQYISDAVVGETD